jgi:uncharacterized protein (TIGR03083 family)
VSAPSQADRTIDALREVHDHIAGVASDLDAEQLAAPSGSTEWPVAQVLGHLGSGSEINLATLLAAVEGLEPPGPESNQPIWDRWDAMSDEDKRDGFLDWSERITVAFESLSPEQRADVRIDLGFLPEPVDVAMLGGMRLNELTLHGWDVDVTFDQHATLPPAGLPLVLGGMGMMVRFAGRAEELDGSALVRVELTHPSEVVGLAIDEGTSLGDAPAVGEADTILHAPTEAFVRLLAGRLAPEHTPGSVQTEGTRTLDDLRKVFPGY